MFPSCHVVLSANSETRTIMKGIKHGACDYIVKPVRLEQLMVVKVTRLEQTAERRSVQRRTNRLWMLLVGTARTHQPRRSQGSSGVVNYTASS
jgi:response regulator of citrate/malate metabolism